jgi:trehalose-phosphatase
VRYLFNRWDAARRALGRPETVLWLFDFDGTLAPIVKHPRDAIMRPGVRRLLRKLAQRFPGRVGVLSGRPLEQVRRKVGIPGLLYAGTQGFEIQGPRTRWTRLVSPRRIKQFKELISDLHRQLKGVRGLWIEDKKWTLCVHYRETRRDDRARVDSFLKTVRTSVRRAGFKTGEALQAMEIFSDTHWDKGQAAHWLTGRTRARRVFYAGDDATDESVFRVLRRSGVAVRIGRSATSHAAYYLKRQSESAKLLQRILNL